MTAVLVVARPNAADRAGWRRLYDGYAAFYKRPMTDAIADRVWAWIAAPGEGGPCEGVVARAGGAVVGLAHFRDMASPLRGAVAGFLDDLFVDPAHRGGGVARALLDHVAAVGRARGWPFYRWLTGDDNYRARTLYDRVATRTMWLTYQRDL